MARIPIEVTVNGRPSALEVAANHTLLDVLRNDLRLTGTKECCLVGECGACTVLIDGLTVDSCLVLAAEADARHHEVEAGQRRSCPAATGSPCHGASSAASASLSIRVRCRLSPGSRPARAEIEDGLAGNLCRCAGYEQIIEAVLAAARAAGDREGQDAPEVTPVIVDRASTPDASLAPQ